MKQRNPYLLPVSLAIEAFVVLGIACVFMPAGWNMIPLLLIACVAVALAIKLRMLRAAPERPVAEDRTLEIDEDDLKVMDSAPQPTPQPTANLGRRINRAFGPITAGLLIDLVDFTSFGPIGLVFGLPLGGLFGYWIGAVIGTESKGLPMVRPSAARACIARLPRRSLFHWL